LNIHRFLVIKDYCCITPPTRKSTLGRAFLVAAAKAWNSLPPTVAAASTLHSFRRTLKTHLFTASFPLS